jgi:molybdopterin synthase sulfur carrier subunit
MSAPSRLYHTKRFRTSDTGKGRKREKAIIFSKKYRFSRLFADGIAPLRPRPRRNYNELTMRVQVKLFSLLREAVGRSELLIDFRGQTAGELWEELERQFPVLAPFRPARAIAVNRQHAHESSPLSDGDEIAFFPPVSGG